MASKAQAANQAAFKKRNAIAKKIWNDPKRPKSIKTYADAVSAAAKQMKK